jgi:hypothetical protein
MDYTQVSYIDGPYTSFPIAVFSRSANSPAAMDSNKCVPRHGKRGCVDSGTIIWKPNHRCRSSEPDQYQSVPTHPRRECQELSTQLVFCEAGEIHLGGPLPLLL